MNTWVDVSMCAVQGFVAFLILIALQWNGKLRG